MRFDPRILADLATLPAFASFADQLGTTFPELGDWTATLDGPGPLDVEVSVVQGRLRVELGPFVVVDQELGRARSVAELHARPNLVLRVQLGKLDDVLDELLELERSGPNRARVVNAIERRAARLGRRAERRDV